MKSWLATTLLMACAPEADEVSHLLASTSNPVNDVTAVPEESQGESSQKQSVATDIYAAHAAEIMKWTRLYAARGLNACGDGPWEALSQDRFICNEYFPVQDPKMANIVVGEELDKSTQEERVTVGLAIESVSCDVHLIAKPDGQQLQIMYGATQGEEHPSEIYTWTHARGSIVDTESRPGLAGEADFAVEWFSTH